MVDLLHPLLLGLDWMDPEWWLQQFGQQMFWAAVAIVFVEWPEAAGAGLPPVRAAVRLEHVDVQTRRIVIEGDVTFAHAADPGLRHGD